VKLRRIGLRLTAILLVLLAAASVSFRWRRTLQVTDAAGSPVSPSYVAYEYRGRRLNPVHSATYRAGELALVRGDSSGRVVIPAAFHLHRPFPIESHPRVFVEMVYVPRLHNALERFGEDGRAAIADLSSDPARWEGTLRNLSSLIGQLVVRHDRQPLRDTDPATAALARELIGHFRNEYDSLLAKYENAARVKPEMPEHVRWSSPDEQRRWSEAVDSHIAREPRWGMLIRRLFGDQLTLFSRWERELL
jgi:hypothetical protein